MIDMNIDTKADTEIDTEYVAAMGNGIGWAAGRKP